MKLTNRAKSALATAGYPVNETSAIAQLVAFAAQNSGIEAGNYFSPYDQGANLRNGVKAFKDEQRSISQEWRRFKQALTVAAIEGVTDADVIAEAPHAFSGRLEWKPKQHTPASAKANGGEGAWHYCTGQYFCTEYRAAAATLLEYATRKVRQARPPTTQERITSIAELKALNARNGGCWFEASTMRFFRTRIESGIIAGHYFITSEQREDDTPRNFTVRSFTAEGLVATVGEFHDHKTKADAMDALREHVKTTATVNA